MSSGNALADSTTQSAAERAIKLAGELLDRAAKLQTPQERRQQAELDRMVSHAADKATMVEMTDQAFRTHTAARVADQLTHLLDVQGIPRFFNPLEQAMLKGFQSFGEYLPGVAIPLVKEQMRRETANVILPAEAKVLTKHLRNRQKQGVGMNVNLLGEAILGEQEARRRIQQCIDTLRLDDVHCLSVKISTLYSQVSSLARRHTVSTVADRLESLFRTADREIDKTTGTGKFVYLDMEEYRDLYLTADILCETLERPGLEQTRSGVALQAYIPDSDLVLQRLIEWSGERVDKGGTPLTIRLVKGANLEMERVESSIGGHPQAPYKTKLETDANFKRMLMRLMDGADNGSVRVGLASHNLFDVALGMVWAQERGIGDRIQIEMLEGMANHQRRAISEHNADMLLYAPACFKEGFLNAIGYLIRRLDENTGPQNFLRHSYKLTADSHEFAELAADFRMALDMASTISNAPRRTNERDRKPDQPPAAAHWSELVNEPDTDWAVPAHSAWAERILERWKIRSDEAAPVISLSIGDQLSERGEEALRESFDPSRPGVVSCRYQAATRAQVREAVDVASTDTSGWRKTTAEHRHALLRRAAQNLRERRGDLIGAMVSDGGKTVTEADPEVSEAIDFTEFYPLTAVYWDQMETVRTSPRGVVAVVSPWNFPLAIPCGGISSALAAGNSVILKPASNTVLPASLLCEAFWDAGIPRDALQLIPCDGAVAGEALVRNALVNTVVLTGGTETARRMLDARPGLHLLAETGGKNATIVTAMADRDLAIKHVVHSAFGHSGQKCSATSLLLLENEIFHDEQFKSALADAVGSLQVGSSWDLATRMGPLIDAPNEDLARGLKTLEDDESWLVIPEHIVDNPNLYRPGVKWNIKPGGFMHLTELFGPVLGVMPYSRLEEAIDIVRSTGYGLTSGLESLDDREVDLWKSTIHAGNLYINRPTTGAIVLRQPFGGVGLSAYGPGVKAGGPHYVLALMNIEEPERAPDTSLVEELKTGQRPIAQLAQWLHAAADRSQIEDATSHRVAAAMGSAIRAFDGEFSKEHDTIRLVGQDNWRRYRPARAITIRVTPEDAVGDALISIGAAVAVQAQISLSMDPAVENRLRALLESTADAVPGLIHPIEETDEQLAARVQEGHVSRLRLLRPGASDSLAVIECSKAFVTIVDEPVLTEGRIECLRYLDEQSVSCDYHRYGNLGRRADEERRPVL